MRTASEIREEFLKYFEDKGHKRIRSGSLIPENDPTLLFTNAGMNQFKDVFLGLEKHDSQRAVSSQQCMRVSGKHNDLETVGRTARHHTFFEMLGNFSFGDYFKKDAIRYAWELCTQIYSIPADRLTITVYEQDDEAFQLWKDDIGIPLERIVRMGKEENFWSMGPTGPCGPCSELHYDMGASPAGHPHCTVECDCGRFVEIWNLVFMQFNRDASQEKTPLAAPSIDTGMGLERLSCVLQGVSSNYDTDLFRPIINEVCQQIGVTYGQSEEKDISLRILADHSRACTFLINNGIAPGNEGRGYVLRKIMRRAIRHGKILGLQDPFVHTLTTLVAELMQDAYPELLETREYVAKVVKQEEENFSTTLVHGTELLDELCHAKSENEILSGKDLFRLYDTYGFPFDLAKEIVSERGLKVDEEGFYSEMEKQRARARASWKGGEKKIKPIYTKLAQENLTTEFTGYARTTKVSGQILAIVAGEKQSLKLTEGKTGQIIFDKTPFYARAGGQVADQGVLRNSTAKALVEDVHEPISGLRLHQVKVVRGSLQENDVVSMDISLTKRNHTSCNHTATHLLHAALREVLGEHVKQAGSLVDPNRVRFDFTHYTSVSNHELSQIEELVNRQIRKNIRIETETRDLDEATQEGAMALFSEKYQQQVRVVKVPGFSMELCGGTHATHTGSIALFKIIHEGSVSAGIRRLEALTGKHALDRFLDGEILIGRMSEELKVQRDDLFPTLEKLTHEMKKTTRQLTQLQLQLAQKESQVALEEINEIEGIQVIAKKVDNLDRTSLRQLADELKNQMNSGVVVLGTSTDDKVNLTATVTSDLTDRISAKDLIQEIAPLVDGGGGGKADIAEAGGKNPAGLDKALKRTYSVLEKLLG